MLDWISGQDDPVAADSSKLLDPPETPAPVFAIRAFKSALFGTPGADDEDNTKTERDLKQQNNSADQRRRESEPPKLSVLDAPTDALKPPNMDKDAAANAIVSPTKSILMTPGTTSNRRKTVSFGESVVDNERKREEASMRPSTTPTTTPGSISSQWSSGSSGSQSKPRSKLTQALMDSREKTPKASGSPQKLSKKSASVEIKAIPAPTEDDNDETINLDEPRSQSGKYWKSEFDNYRTKTTKEIRRLIQYRSAAKSYARKKDTEAQRLADKLREEEVKVADMERHVTQLASNMVGDSSNADKEQLVQDLTKQTALALQYKHRVSLLRKLLEKHGVVGSEMDEITGSPGEDKSSAKSPTETTRELWKTRQALEQAHAKIEEMEHQQLDFGKLRDLAHSSEQKASELAKENATLKQTLARFKQEMTKYEGRRKDKEAKLRQRESKLETRIQEYRERLKTASQEHRDIEQDLRDSFEEERRRMQGQMDMLKLKVTTMERLPELRSRARYSGSPRKGYSGVQVFDFGHSSPEKPQQEETEEIEEPPSPSPRAKDRRSGPRTALGELDLKKYSKALGLEDPDEQLTYFDDSPRKIHTTKSHMDGDTVPPPSPPAVSTLDHATRARLTKQRYNPENYRSYVPSHATTSTLARQLAAFDDSHQVRTERPRSRRSPVKYSLDALTGRPETYHVDRPRRRQSIASLHEPLPMDRRLAAQARLKRKDESRKVRDGKENVRAVKAT